MSKIPAITYSEGLGGPVGWIKNQNRPPTYAEAEKILTAAGKRGCKFVRWRHTRENTIGDSHVIITRCECGEVALGDEVCATCRLLASLLTDRYQRGPQVQFERCERALDRVAQLLVELQAKAATPLPSSDVERGT